MSGESAATAVETNSENGQSDVEFAKCQCCGLTEECTPAYIAAVRETHGGRWICGLCSEAVSDESRRSAISTEEAMSRHVSFCEEFRYGAPPALDSADHLIAAVKQLLRRSLDSPKFARSGPKLARSGSCFPAIAG